MLSMDGDPWYLSGTDLEIDRNLQVNNTYVEHDIMPTDTLTGNIGSGALRWLNLFVQNINAEEIDAFNLHLSENLTVDGYINDINISNLLDESDLLSYNTTLENNNIYARLSGGNNFTGNQNVDGNVTANWFKGKFNWTSGDDWNIFDGSTLLFNSSKLTTTYYNATQSLAVAGTVAGTLADTQHPDGKYDGVTFNVTEASGSPGLDLRINFTGITKFNAGVIRYKTDSLAGTFPIIQLWNYDDSIWEDYPAVATSLSFATIEQPVFDDSDHVLNGVVQMRLYKSSNGNTQNKYYIDWISISKGFGTPSGEEVDPYFKAWLNNPILTNSVNISNTIINSSGITTTGNITVGQFTLIDNGTHLRILS